MSRTTIVGIGGNSKDITFSTYSVVTACLCEVGRFDLAARLRGFTMTADGIIKNIEWEHPRPDVRDAPVIDQALRLARAHHLLTHYSTNESDPT